ncbi:MAG: hypothetical protein HY267_06560 [Deltaproteobacteria bacterium]|nr:hypothetical protein [Deltaproteobacteria bacterium]
MQRILIRLVPWSLRLFSVAIALWWPAILRDPIYTPRQARLTGQALHLPSLVSAISEDERALAIFWGWENRSLVSSRWMVGPYQGVRNPEARRQTLLVLLLFWGVGSFFLYLLTMRGAASPENRTPGRLSFLSTPIWQWFERQ